MDKPPPSGSKSSDQKKDQVTGDDGDKSPPATPRAGTGSVHGSSAVPRGDDPSPPPPPAGNPKGGGGVGKSTKPLSVQGKQPPTSGSSATAAGSPPAPSESPKGGCKGGKSKKPLRGKKPALLTGGSSAAAAGPPPPPNESPKGGGEGGKNTKTPSEREKQPAFSTGGSSATAAGSPPPSESLQVGKAEEEGLKKKRKKAAFDAPQYPTPCSICSRPFSSWKALFGHMRTHKDRQWRGVYPPPISSPRQQEQAEELTSSLLNIGQRILASEKGNEAEGEGSVVAEGSASSSAEESRQKKIHMQLDLNKKAPEGSDEEGGGEGDNGGA